MRCARACKFKKMKKSESSNNKPIRGPPLPTSDFISRVTFSDVENASLLLGASTMKLDTRLLISLAALRRQCLEGDCLVTPPSRLTATQISRDLRSAWETLRGIDPAVCRARYVSLAKAAISEHNFEINIELNLSSWEPFSSGYSIDDTTHLQLKDTNTTNVQRPLEQEKEGEEVVYHNIAFSGWLLKKRERVTMIGNPWRARFCVIVGRQLRSYEGNESSAEEARDIFLLSHDISIQAETTLGKGSLIGTTTSTNGGSISTSSSSSSLSSALITDTAGKTSINRQIFPEGFDMTVITSIKPPESVTERGILAPILISQSGQSFLFATFGESALEDRERWMAALRASQFGALGGDDESENRLGLTTNTTGNSSISHPSFASPVRTSLKVKDTKSLVLTTPRRPQSIRMALNLNDPSSTSISMSERRRSSALSNLEIAHHLETPRKSLPIPDETRSTTTPKVLTKSDIQTTPVSKTSSTLVAGVISTPVAGTISTPISSDVSSSSTTSNVISSSSFIPAPLPSSSVLASKILKLQELCRSKSVMKDLKSVGWDEANATRNNGVTVYPALDGGASSRGDTFISHPRNAILTLITSIPSRKIIDERFDKGETIETFDQAERPHTSIQHMTFYGIPPVSNRDYVTITHWCLNQDGTIMVVSGSIEDKRCPEITGVVRAELTLTAWVVRPRSVLSNREVDETKGCDVTYMNFTDLKGWVPMTIKRTVSSQQALLVARVRDILDGGYLNGKPPLKQVMNVPIKTSLSLEDGFEKSTSISTSDFQTPLKPRRLSIDVEKVSSSLGMIKASTTAITKGEESNTDRTLQLEAEVVRLLSVIDTMKEKELGLRRDLATLTMRFAGISTSIGSSGLLKPGAHFSTQTAPVFSLLASASLQQIKKEEDKR